MGDVRVHLIGFGDRCHWRAELDASTDDGPLMAGKPLVRPRTWKPESSPKSGEAPNVEGHLVDTEKRRQMPETD